MKTERIAPASIGALVRSISEISSCVFGPGRTPNNNNDNNDNDNNTVDFRIFIVFLGRDPGTLKSDIVSKKHPQLICSDLKLSN